MTNISVSLNRLNSFNTTERELLASYANWISTDDLEPGLILYLSSLKEIQIDIEEQQLEDVDKLHAFIKVALDALELDQYIFN